MGNIIMREWGQPVYFFIIHNRNVFFFFPAAQNGKKQEAKLSLERYCWQDVLNRLLDFQSNIEEKKKIICTFLNFKKSYLFVCWVQITKKTYTYRSTLVIMTNFEVKLSVRIYSLICTQTNNNDEKNPLTKRPRNFFSKIQWQSLTLYLTY